MADDDHPTPGYAGEDPLAEGPVDRRSVGGQAPAGGRPEPNAGGGFPLADDDPLWAFGWHEQVQDAEPDASGGLRSAGGDPLGATARHEPRRPAVPAPGGRRLPRRGSFSVVLSLAALALGVVAVVLAAGESTSTVQYVPVRPPEIIGPAPDPGAAPVPPPTAVAPAPVVLPAGETPEPTIPTIESTGDAAVPAIAAPVPPPVAPVVLEPVVEAARKVEPSVVLLQTSQGQGSGIIYDASGLILTAAHVVAGAEPLDDLFASEGEAPQGFPQGEDLGIGPDDFGPADRGSDPQGSAPGGLIDSPDVIVQLASGVRTGGKVLAASDELDVAVVQIDPTLNFTVAETAPLSSVDVGQTAVAVGSPFGMENVVTVGVVSAVNQVLGGEDMPPLGMIQTDAPINFGNSGGALADLQGRVIGMNVAIQSTFGGGNIGVGFATPIEVARWIAEELRAGREVRFGFLGITGYTPRLGDPGAIVASVTPGGPAEAAGMQVNDRIVTFAGQPVGSMDELSVAVRLQAPGTEVEVEVVRDDLLIRLFIPLGDRGESIPAEPAPEPEPEPEFEP